MKITGTCPSVVCYNQSRFSQTEKALKRLITGLTREPEESNRCTVSMSSAAIHQQMWWIYVRCVGDADKQRNEHQEIPAQPRSSNKPDNEHIDTDKQAGTQRQIEIQTDTHRQAHTQKHTDKQTYIDTDRHRDISTHAHTDSCRDEQIHRQTQTDIYTDGHIHWHMHTLCKKKHVSKHSETNRPIQI